MSQSGWNNCVCQIFYSKYKQMSETFFSRTVFHIINTRFGTGQMHSILTLALAPVHSKAAVLLLLIRY